jgi:hypothetical protein
MATFRSTSFSPRFVSQIEVDSYVASESSTWSISQYLFELSSCLRARNKGLSPRKKDPEFWMVFRSLWGGSLVITLVKCKNYCPIPVNIPHWEDSKCSGPQSMLQEVNQLAECLQSLKGREKSTTLWHGEDHIFGHQRSQEGSRSCHISYSRRA